MSSNGKKRAASDSDEFEPSTVDKKKAKKQSKNTSKPSGSRGRQPDPDPLTESEDNEYEDSEGEMEVFSTQEFDRSPFMIDITDDMKRF